jgi:ATP-dependent DNA ligase
MSAQIAYTQLKFGAPQELACVSDVRHAADGTKPMLPLINPSWRAEPFDHADWIFEAKFDGFRAAADTVPGRLISRTGNRMKRFGAGARSPAEGARVRRAEGNHSALVELRHPA